MIFTMYTIVFVTMIALAVNVYLIGTALLQQRSVAEYVAMAVLKLDQDRSSFDPAQCLQTELSYLNCILQRAEVAGQVGIGGSSNFYLPAGQLRMQEPGSNDCGEDSFCWPLYQVVGGDKACAKLVMGTYDNTQGFTAAGPNSVLNGSFNAVKLRLHFNPTKENTKMIAPLIGLFGKDILLFSSSALAYRTPDGGIHLAIDPTLSM